MQFSSALHILNLFLFFITYITDTMIIQDFRFLLSYMEGHLDFKETLMGHGLRKVENHWNSLSNVY